MKNPFSLALLLLAGLCAGGAQAGYQVEVLSDRGEPLAGAVVYLEATGEAPSQQPAAGVMDQIDRQFVPYILVVQRGAEVHFPNSDSIKHHVYSFSEAKTFEIRLYRDAATDPIRFDAAGEVELGCNVHDWMLGYIYVVDTPYFARTDGAGVARIDAPQAHYRLGVWHPRIQDSEDGLMREVSDPGIQHRVSLQRPLLPNYDPSPSVDFDDYD